MAEKIFRKKYEIYIITCNIFKELFDFLYPEMILTKCGHPRYQ